MVGPIVSGVVAEHLGWRTFWHLNTGVLGFVLICCLFLFPETKFSRPHAPEQISLKDVSVGETLKVEYLGKGADRTSAHIEDATTPPREARTALPARKWLGRGVPSKAQWAIFPPYTGNALQDIWVPWKLFAFPIVEFAAFVVSWSSSALLTVNLTQAQVFAAPPYLFSSSIVGYLNFATLVGALIGLFSAGPLSDAVAARATKRNRGVREPEMRLVAMVPFVICMIIGNIV